MRMKKTNIFGSMMLVISVAIIIAGAYCSLNNLFYPHYEWFALGSISSAIIGFVSLLIGMEIKENPVER